MDERDSCPIWNRNIIDLQAHLGKVDDELRQFSHSATLSFHIPETNFIIDNERQSKYKWEKWLRGHAICLSRYFSHIGQVFNQDEKFEKEGVHQDELENARKFFASQLSSLELTLLYLYSLTPMGEFLWKKGYLIKYGLLDLLDKTTIPLELLPDSSNRGKGGP